MRKQYIGIASFVSVVCLASSAARANNPYCDGRAGWSSTSCADPASNEVVVYGDGNGGGKCMRFSSTFVDPVNSPGAPPGSIPNLGTYGFNDCISSVKVGSNVRLLAFKDTNYNQYLPGVPHNVYWQMATYEPDFNSPWSAEPTVNDDFSSLIVHDITQTNGEPIPNRYILSDPTSDSNAFWEEESQGLCHNKTDWFITQEVDISGPINPNFTCVQDQKLMGRVWKVPRDYSLNLSAPYPPVYRDQKDMPAAFSTWSGYRHYGDPDCQTISGRDYVFIPVQTCASNSGTEPLPIVMVLDSDLNFVTAWTIPPQPNNYDVKPLATCLGVPLDANAYSNVMGGHGLASWVAVRPSLSMTASNVEVWMGTDVCNGLGLQIFTGDLTVPGDSVAMSYRSSGPVITDFLGTPEYFKALQGGVFSPSGRTLYMTSGDNNQEQGGIRVILPDTGQEITESGNDYGPFNFQHDRFDWLGIPTGQEPEGLDFLDTRCPGTPVEDFGADPADQQSAQLHVVMNHNGLDYSGDQVELRHYSVPASASNPMCEPMLFDGTSEPAVSSQGGGTLDVFAVAGGRVFQRSYDNPGWDPTWTPLPSLESPRSLVGKPASVSWGPGRIDVFAHDDLGNIRHLWANGGSWAPTWETIAAAIDGGCSGYGCTGLTATSWGVNRLDVFDAGPEDLIQVTYDNGWNPPRYPLGDASPPTTGAISAVSWGPGRIDLAVAPWFTDNAWQIGQYYSDDGVNFSGPYPLGAVGDGFLLSFNVALSSWGSGDLEVVTVGTSLNSMLVGQKGFRPGLGWVDWTTSSLSPGAGSVWPSSISSTSSGDGRIDIVYGRKDPTYSTTTVWHAWYNNTDPGEWFGPEPL